MVKILSCWVGKGWVLQAMWFKGCFESRLCDESHKLPKKGKRSDQKKKEELNIYSRDWRVQQGHLYVSKRERHDIGLVQ